MPYDEHYWGPNGVDISRWGKGEVMRGARYRDVGPVTDGAPNQRRSFGAGRKRRGLSSIDLEKGVVESKGHASTVPT